MKRIYRLVVFLGVLLVAPGAFAQKMMEEIVARVNNDIILKSEYESRLKAAEDGLSQPPAEGQPPLRGAALESAKAATQKDMMRNLIDETLLLQKAKDLGMNAELEIVKTMERLRVQYKLPSEEALEEEIVKQGMSVDQFKSEIGNRYLTGRVVQSEVYNRIIISTADLKSYYDAHQKDFVRPAGVRIAEIAVSTEKRSPEEVQGQRKKIEDAQAALKKGDEFGAVAQKFSEDDSASNGGELGFLEKGQMSKEYDDAVTKLVKAGDVSDIIPMSWGFVILKLENRHDGGVLSFEIAEAEIQNIILAQRADPKLREFLTKLRDEGSVWIRDGYTDTGAVVKPAKAGGGGGRN